MKNSPQNNEEGYSFYYSEELPATNVADTHTPMQHAPKQKNTATKWKVTTAVFAVVIVALAFVLWLAFSSYYNELYPAVEKLSEDSDNAAVKLGDAEYAYNVATEETKNAKESYASAEAKLAEATNALNECKSVYALAATSYDEAKASAEEAKLNYDMAVTKLETAEGKYATASEELDTAKKSYTAASNECESLKNSLTDATQKLNAATTALNTAKSAYESAVTLYNAIATESENEGESSVTIPTIDTTPSAAEVFANIVDAVLEIRNYNVAGVYSSLGSGFIFDKSGLVCTNFHVISGAYELRAYYGENDDDYYQVEYVAGMDADIDLAVLKLKLPEDKTEFPTVPLATKEPAVGDTIYALGSNMGFFRTFSTSIVAYVNKELEGFEGVQYIQYFDLTHSGNSGCPIFNANGEVIAVNQLGDTATGDHGFGIPIKHLRQLSCDKNLTPMEATYAGAEVIDSKLLKYETKFDMRSGREYVIITGFQDADSANDLIQDSVVAFPSKIDDKPVKEININFSLSDTYAAYHYYFVEHLVIPEGVTSLNGNVFYYAPSTLLTVKLPSTLTFIGEDVFSSCFGIYRFFMEGNGNSNVYLKDEVLYGKDVQGQTALLRYPYCKSDFGEDEESSDDDGEFATTSFSVPSNVQYICDFAALYSGFTELKFPDRDGSVELHIGALSFCFNTNLKSVTLPLGTKSIAARAFASCTALEEVTFAGDVGSIGEIYTLTTTGLYYGAFDSCTAVKTITFGGNVETLGDRAFLGTAVTELTLPAGITDMGKYAFARCEKLITLNAENFTTEELAYGTFAYATALKSLTFADALTSIGDYAFVECVSITAVTFPTSLESIGANAFDSCTKLASIDFSAESKVTAIGNYAFFNCDALVAIELPSTLRFLGAYALSNNDALLSVTIPEGVKVIQEGLVFNNSKLTSVTLPSTVTRIADGAFWQCPAMSTLTIKATLPPFITEYLFEDESTLSEPIGVTIIIPYGSMEAYLNDSGWRFVTNYDNITLQEETL